jgi:putative flippase GtrA
MSDRTRIAVLYSLFAALALILNLVSQAIFVRFYFGDYSILISIIIGTAVGLPVKYVLDKKYIFKFATENVFHDTKLFILYGLMAIVTTAVFWGSEVLFQFVFMTESMRLVGGGMGLVIGYIIKYQLDKKFVFTIK